MKKLLLILAVLFTGGLVMFAMFVAGTILLIRRIPSDWRDRVGDLPGVLKGRVMEHMPAERPWEEILSGVSRIQEQNEELRTLVQDWLPAQESPSSESPSGGAEPA